MKIPEVQDVFNESRINTDDSHDPHIINFIKALGIIYSLKQVGIKSENLYYTVTLLGDNFSLDHIITRH